VGRDPSEIEITAMLRTSENPSVDEILLGAEELAALGVSGLVTYVAGDDPATALEATFGPAMADLEKIEAAPL
jgi:hypothetical protein